MWSPLRVSRAVAFVATVSVVFTCSTLQAASPVLAATLHAGDIVVLGQFPGGALPQEVLVVSPSNGAVQAIHPDPALAQLQGLVVRDNGELLLSDGAQGLLSLDPGTGTWHVLHPPAAFGGTAPSVLALAPGGDVFAAGGFGVVKLPGGTGAPVAVGSLTYATPPTGLACDGANLWVAADPLQRVDPATGAATPLVPCCSGYTMSAALGALQVGPDGFLYGVNFPDGGGPTARANNGVFRIDPASGVTSLFRKGSYILSFAFDAAGSDWICEADNISLTAYGGFLDGNGLHIALHDRGPVAVVPPGVTTPTRHSSWGTIKLRYR